MTGPREKLNHLQLCKPLPKYDRALGAHAVRLKDVFRDIEPNYDEIDQQWPHSVMSPATESR